MRTRFYSEFFSEVRKSWCAWWRLVSGLVLCGFFGEIYCNGYQGWYKNCGALLTWEIGKNKCSNWTWWIAHMDMNFRAYRRYSHRLLLHIMHSWHRSFLDFSAKIVNLFYECRFIVQLKIDDNGLTKVFIPEIPEGLKIPIGNCFPHPKVKKNVSHNEVIFCDNYSDSIIFPSLISKNFPITSDFSHMFFKCLINDQTVKNDSPF